MLKSFSATRLMWFLTAHCCAALTCAQLTTAADNPASIAPADAPRASPDRTDSYTTILDQSIDQGDRSPPMPYAFVPRPGRYELRVKRGWTGTIPFQGIDIGPDWELMSYQNIGNPPEPSTPGTTQTMFASRDPVLQARSDKSGLLLYAIRTGTATLRMAKPPTTGNDDFSKCELRLVVEADTSDVERAIQQAVPNAQVRLFELREGALLINGSLATNQDITVVMEVARVFYPEVINHLVLASDAQETSTHKENPAATVAHPVLPETRQPQELEVVRQQSHLITTRGNVSRVSIADPTVIEIIQYGPTEFSIVGKSVGTTSMIVWLENPSDRLVYNVSTVPSSKPRTTDTRAQELEPADTNPGKSPEEATTNATGNSIGRPRPRLRSIDELRELRNEVRLLRKDIQQLGELTRKRQAFKKDDESTGSTNRRSGPGQSNAHHNAMASSAVSASQSTSESQKPIRAANREATEVQATPAPIILVKTYAVADLMIPPPDENGQAKKVSTKDWLNLVDSITSAVEPRNWECNGGNSTIKVFEATCSLVVRTNDETHQKVAEWFARQRQKMDIQLSLRAWMPRNFDEQQIRKLGIQTEFDADTRSALLTEQDAQKFLETCVPSTLHVPKVTVFNGQVANLDGSLMGAPESNSDFKLRLRGQVVDGGKQVRINFAVNATHPINGLLARPCMIPDAGYALLDVTDEIQRDKSEKIVGRVVVLIQVRVIQIDEPVALDFSVPLLRDSNNLQQAFSFYVGMNR